MAKIQGLLRYPPTSDEVEAARLFAIYSNPPGVVRGPTVQRITVPALAGVQVSGGAKVSGGAFGPTSNTNFK